MKLTDIWPTLGKRRPTGSRRNRSATKKGPGRRHANGRDRARRAAVPKGHWSGPHTNPAANAARAAKAEIGARQYRKQRKVLARAAKESA
jgi:hypothetical protein